MKTLDYCKEKYPILFEKLDMNPLMFLSVGGSTLYGLNTKYSDTDIRGIYLLWESSKIFGLDLYKDRSYESVVINGEEDYALHEFRKFVYLLSKTNSQVLDILYSPDSYIIYKSPEMEELFNNKENLVSTEGVYNSMKGYLYNEIRLTLGERSGKLGGKRKAAIDDYGFSYKNLVQIERLLFCSEYFFEFGIWPTYLPDYNKTLADRLIKIKLNPDSVSMDYVKSVTDAALDRLHFSYNNRKIEKTFDYNLANDLIHNVYFTY